MTPEEAAALIDPEVLALLAIDDQIEAVASATDSFAAYWAGSASASVAHHYARGAYRTVRV